MRPVLESRWVIHVAYASVIAIDIAIVTAVDGANPA